MDEFKKLMLAEKRLKLKNAWNAFVDCAIDEISKQYSFCYKDLVREVYSHYYL